MHEKMDVSVSKRAIFAGSFDPPTNGHLWMIEQGARLFDELKVALGVNPNKRVSFTLKEKMAMLKEMVRPFPNVQVSHFENQYLMDYANEQGYTYILRGLRSVDDFVYEKAMNNANRNINPAVQTIFLLAPPELEEVSSSLVKSLVGSENWEKVVESYVPMPVFKVLLKRQATRKFKLSHPQ